MKLRALLPILVLMPPAPPLALAAEPPDPVACSRRQVPEPDMVRAVRIVSRDRAGAETVTVAHIYGRRDADGGRRLLIRFTEPADVRGSALLMIEGSEEPEIYYKPSEDEKGKRIQAAGPDLPLFGSDFTYEDLQLFEAFRRGGATRQLADEEVRGRPAYVLESRPGEGRSAYARVVAWVDKETCTALRMEMYEDGDRLRKELIVNPESVKKRGEVWLAHRAIMRDLRDYSTTQFLVDSSEQDVAFGEGMFEPAEFVRRRAAAPE